LNITRGTDILVTDRQTDTQPDYRMPSFAHVHRGIIIATVLDLAMRVGSLVTVQATYVTMAVTGVLCWNYWLHPPIVIHPHSVAIVTQHVSVT